MILRSILAAAASFILVWSGLHWYKPGSSKNSSFGLGGEAHKSVLLIGNSRTSHNDMPGILKAMLDNAPNGEHYTVTVRTWDGASLEDYWRDSETRQLLARRWDAVIFQAESRAHSRDEDRQRFFRSADALATAARQSSNLPTFIVNYAYDQSLFERDSPYDHRWHFRTISEDYRQLKARDSADLIRVADVWERLLIRHPNFQLYEDGNHPSLHGSFLQALTIFAHLTHGDASEVTYRPRGVEAVDLDLMKSVLKESAAVGTL